MIRLSSLIAACAALAFLTGCDPDGNREGKASAEWHGVKEVYLEDGTRCVVLDQFKEGGIDCDWAGHTKLGN